MDTGTCLVTIHGMGFQQAPCDGMPGYADGLHAQLQRLVPALGGDPAAEFDRPAGQGAIYVHSDWPVDTRNTEQGLQRLGTWPSERRDDGQVDTAKAPLFAPGATIAHVALVYTHLEDQGPHLGASGETAAKALIAHGHYASLLAMARTGVVDLWAALRHQHQATGQMTPSLQVRSDAQTRTGHPASDGNPSGLLCVVQALDHDVATYVCRHDLRTRVSDFLHEALLRICCRPDVGQVVVNSHSLGTVLAFDALRNLPPYAAPTVRCFVTAGSPLRKFADLFYWGNDAGCVTSVPWRNFWDETDPVADPLAPPSEWRRGGPPVQKPAHPQLYYSYDPDTGAECGIDLTDHQVENAANGAGGGLPAHNYWDNNAQFVPLLASYLEEVVAGRAVPA